jgi:ABC-2 type transport system permease protein
VFNFFFVAMLFLLTFSNGIIAYTSLFGRNEATYLLAAPIPPRDVVLVKYLETLLFSSWSLILLGLPLMLAIADFAQDAESFCLLFLAMFLFFVPIPGALGMLGAWFTARYLPRDARRLLLALAATTMIVVIVWGIRTVQLSGGSSSVWLKNFFLKMEFIQSVLLPNTWVSLGIERAMHDKPLEAVMYLLVVLANALFLSLVTVRVVGHGFSNAYDRATTARGRTARSAGKASGGFVGWIFAYLPRGLRLIAVKDFRTFLRDPLQWSQLGILFGLMALYLLNMPRFQIDLITDRLSLLVPFLNLSAVSFILATFTTRFVFPLVSLEGHQLWLIGLLPIPRGHILLAKFAFAMTVSTTVAVGTMTLAAWIIQMTLAWALIYLAVTFAICVGLCGLAVGLGARMPMFGEQNPTRIANGFGGTVNLIASVGLIVLCLAGMGVAAVRASTDPSAPNVQSQTIQFAIAVICFAFAVGIIAMQIGARHLKNLEA